MQKIFNLLLACICALSLLASCGKKGDPGPAGPGLTGNINGYVNSVDENGNQQSKTGTTITLEGATTQTTTTDANGRYEFASVPNGTYNLSYSRTGYATLRRYAVAHAGGDQPTFLSTATLSQVSTGAVTGVSAVANNSSGTVTVTYTLTSPTPTSVLRYAIFASNSANPTANGTGILLQNGSFSYSNSTVTSATVVTTLTKFALNNAGFASGSPVYLALYGSTASLSSYTDPATGRNVYPSLSPTASNIVSVIVP